MMTEKITIDPVTRLEGHGKIEIFLDAQGNVDQAYFQIPELRGFEKFVAGRPAEDMPQITSRICGVCPTAHHMAATKALDEVYQVTPPPAAALIREIFYYLFMLEDHLLHFYYLGGPDFILAPDAPKAKRNILGVIDKVGLDTGKRVIEIRKQCRRLMEMMGGKPIHPVLGVPGGVAKKITKEIQTVLQEFIPPAIDFALFSLKIFRDIVLSNEDYVAMMISGDYTHRTNYMAMVDQHQQLNFYDGCLKVVNPLGEQIDYFPNQDYLNHMEEHVEPWTYIKFPYLKQIGWRGLVDGVQSGLFRVAPLARLNVSNGMPTPQAQASYEEFYNKLGGKPVHHTLAIHWARLIEVLYAAEHLAELVKSENLLSDQIRNRDFSAPGEGVGVVEAPRGTLIHHYRVDDNGVITAANLIVASQNNAGAMCLSVDKAAKALIKNGKVDEAVLNKIEMAFRAYDPCFGCATHSLPGKMPLELRLRDQAGRHFASVVRNDDGRIYRKDL